MLLCAAMPAMADQTIETVDGFVSLGSSAGMIYDGQHEFSYGRDTRNLDILLKPPGTFQ